MADTPIKTTGFVGFDIGGVLGAKVPAAMLYDAEDAGFTVYPGTSAKWVFVARPGVREFIADLAQSRPDLKVFVWSTMQKATVKHILGEMDLLDEVLSFYLHQSSCTPAPTDDDPYAHQKKLVKLLKSSSKNPGGRLGWKNLLFIDDNPDVPVGKPCSLEFWGTFDKAAVLEVIQVPELMQSLEMDSQENYARVTDMLWKKETEQTSCDEYSYDE